MLKNIFLQLKRDVNRQLIRQKYLFFNIMLHKFIWDIDTRFEDAESCLAYIKFKNRDINELDDGTIYLNHKILENPDFNSKNYLFVLLHEMLHVTFMHGARCSNRDSFIWNIAADHVVNSLIKDSFPENEVTPLGGYGKNNGCIYFKDISKGLTTEEVYDILIKDAKRFTISKTNSNGDQTTFRIIDEKTGDEFEITISNKDLKENEKNFSRSAAEIYNNIKERGNLPGTLDSVFKNFFKTEVPWDEILRDAIKKAITPIPNSRGWKTLNKLFMPHGYILPGITYELDQKVDIGIVSIDTSGSISDKELNLFASILVESLHYFNKLIMITHDSKIHQEETFQNHQKIELETFIREIGFKGRGGTSHKDVLEKIEKIDSTENEGISIFISLTDGYSDIEEYWKSSYKFPSYFIITRNGRLPRCCGQSNPKAIQVNSDERR